MPQRRRHDLSRFGQCSPEHRLRRANVFRTETTMSKSTTPEASVTSGYEVGNGEPAIGHRRPGTPEHRPVAVLRELVGHFPFLPLIGRGFGGPAGYALAVNPCSGCRVICLSRPPITTHDVALGQFNGRAAADIAMLERRRVINLARSVSTRRYGWVVRRRQAESCHHEEDDNRSRPRASRKGEEADKPCRAGEAPETEASEVDATGVGAGSDPERGGAETKKAPAAPPKARRAGV